MWMLLLEAVGAGALLVLMVWWTMFAGRRGGEPAEPTEAAEGQPAERPGPDAEHPPRPPTA